MNDKILVLLNFSFFSASLVYSQVFGISAKPFLVELLPYGLR
jgi:hypothetical protein